MLVGDGELLLVLQHGKKLLFIKQEDAQYFCFL